MRRTVLLMTAALAVGLVCESAPAKDAAADVELTVGEKQELSLSVRVEQTVCVRLAGNATTGYQWELAGIVNPDGKWDVLKQEGKIEYHPDAAAKDRVGAGGYFTTRFRAVQAGKAKVTLEYKRPWEKKEQPIKTFVLTVVVLPAGQDVDSAKPEPPKPEPSERHGRRDKDKKVKFPKVLSYVGEKSEDRKSLGGTGQAVLFQAPEDGATVHKIDIYASRYGTAKAPDEDFHIYLLDAEQKEIARFAVPYGKIPRGKMKWHSLKVKPTDVPEKFYVAVDFHAAQTKGVYLGVDREVKETHSLIGLVGRGFQAVPETFEWMIRVQISPTKPKGDHRTGS